MELSVPFELEELILCSCCHMSFNDSDCIPKMLTCRHYFCLKCVNSILRKGTELYCVHCWKRTELPGPDMKSNNLPTYSAILCLTKNLNMIYFNSKTTSGKQRSSSSTSSVNSLNGNKSTGAASNNTSSTTACGNSGKTFLNSEPVDARTNNNIKKGENCMTHAMPNTLWCSNCYLLICRACAASDEHKNHAVKSHVEAKETIQSDISNDLFSMQRSINDIQHLVLKQRDFLLKILESCTALKTQIETELINHLPTLEISEMRESLCKAKICLNMLGNQSPAEAIKLYTTLHLEKQRLNSRYQEMFLQCKLDELIRNCGLVFDFDLIRQALNQLHNCVINGENLDIFVGINGAATHHNPVLLLANYCISQLYSRHVLATKQQQLLLSSSSNCFFQAHTHPAHQPPNQEHSSIQLSECSPHDEAVQTKTYADITVSSPKTIHQISSTNAKVSKDFGNLLPENRSEATGRRDMPSPIGVCIPPLLTGTYVSNDFNSLSVPTLTMIQHIQQKQHSNQKQKPTASSSPNIVCNPTVHVYPIYYFNIDMNGQTVGRILIEVRNDVAPKMAKNFGSLATSELGFGYKGCQIFQCWENESIITGDFELNNGRGGRSIFEENFFMPDDTKILAIRGSVGMRRSQKRHDNMGLVGSQFRIILREMRGFTGIFAFVVDGLELVEKISQAGDSAGKPQSNILILSCGKYQ